MKKLLVAIAFAALMAGPAHAALAVGAKAPEIVTQAAQGGTQMEFKLSAALKEGPVVMYFYPAAFTKGCTLQSKEFAARIEEFKAQGASVVGMSADDIVKLKDFSTKECSSKFPLGVASADTIKAYDVALVLGNLLGKSNRTTYVIAPDGSILLTYSELNPAEHVSRSLEAVKAWKAKQAK